MAAKGAEVLEVKAFATLLPFGGHLHGPWAWTLFMVPAPKPSPVGAAEHVVGK
jgi:hypothetical protein